MEIKTLAIYVCFMQNSTDSLTESDAVSKNRIHDEINIKEAPLDEMKP